MRLFFLTKLSSPLVQSLPSIDKMSLSYCEPCNGCSKCYKRFEAPADLTSTGAGSSRETTRWWHIFVSRKTQNNSSDKNQSKPDLRSIINENCSEWSAVENINCANVLVKNTNQCKLQVFIHSEPLTQNQFISDGCVHYHYSPYP